MVYLQASYMLYVGKVLLQWPFWTRWQGGVFCSFDVMLSTVRIDERWVMDYGLFSDTLFKKKILKKNIFFMFGCYEKREKKYLGMRGKRFSKFEESELCRCNLDVVFIFCFFFYKRKFLYKI